MPIIALLFFGLLLALHFAGKLPMLLLCLYLINSLISFVVYAYDKSAARKNQWRIKENTLHILSILGGWPGALLAQHWLRHKSQKTSFRIVFWLTVLLNGLMLGGFIVLQQQ